MSLVLEQIVSFWSTQGALSALLPASSVWVNVAGDVSAMPYVILKQQSEKIEYVFTKHQIITTFVTMTVFAATLASVDNILASMQTTFLYANNVTPNARTCWLENLVPAGASQGAYSGMQTWAVWEAF